MNSLQNPAGIAIMHSVFNIFATIIFSAVPFMKLLEKLAYISVRDKKNDSAPANEFQILDPRFLATPSVALEQCKSIAVRMADCARDTLKLSMGLMSKYNDRDVEIVNENEEKVDVYEDKLRQLPVTAGFQEPYPRRQPDGKYAAALHQRL